MVTDTIKDLYSPEKVLGCVQKAMLGQAGDRLTDLQQAIYKACIDTSPVLVSRFEMSEEADDHSVFIIFFRSTKAIFVATLEDLRSIFIDSDHEFDTSNTKLVMRTLVPLREGEDLGPITPEDQDLISKVKSLAVVLNPDPSIKPELN
jgi:hypothetical protein